MATCVVDLYTTGITSLAKISTPNHIDFSRRAGFSYHQHFGVIDTSRSPSWSKLLIVSRLLTVYDTVLWLDTDTLVLDAEKAAKFVLSNELSNLCPYIFLSNEVKDS